MMFGQNNRKNSVHAIEMLFFLQIQEEKIENDGKENDGKKRPKPSKTVAKTMKTSAKQMEKGWGLHFSAVLSSAQSTTNFEVS